MLLSLGRGVPQRPAAAARGALPGSFGLHVHSAGGGGRSAQPQSRPPSGTCQLHVALVLSIFKAVLHLLSTNPNHWKILSNLILEEVRISASVNQIVVPLKHLHADAYCVINKMLGATHLPVKSLLTTLLDKSLYYPCDL